MVPYRILLKRIQKDKAQKEERRKAYREKYDCLEKIFTPRHYIKCIRKCRKGVRFKHSVQRYCARPFKKIGEDLHGAVNVQFLPVNKNRSIVIRERGHERFITPIQIRDRVNQRVLCDYGLAPLMTRRLIYDNGACLKGKGVSFSRKRFEKMLESAKREWGNSFDAYVFDFHRFFENLPHSLCYREIDRAFQDKRIVNLTARIVEDYAAIDAERDKNFKALSLIRQHRWFGVCLGSHVSQLMGICALNFFDHWIKDVLGIKYYIRHVDDCIILHNDRNLLKKLAKEICVKLSEAGLILSEKKSHIVPIRKGVRFLKIRYIITDELKTIRKIWGKSVIRMRRKLRKFVGKVLNGKMTEEQVYLSFQSWQAHSRECMSYHTRKKMFELYHLLFGDTYIQKWRCAAA